ncbi:MAG: DUF6247 family protein [Pseudonocardiaceae bacterium]
MSVANIKIGQSGSAVRAVLADVAPDECAEFEAEFHATMAEVDDNFDTSRVDALVRRWWARAVVLLNPDPEADATWERVKAGDTSDLVEQWRPQPDGVQHVYRKDPRGQWVFLHTRPAVEV